MQASVAHTQTPLQTGYEMPKAGFLLSSSLPHCGQIGCSVSATCSSRWLPQTIRLSYAIQFAQRPSKFRGVHFTSVKAADVPVLHAEIAVLLVKDVIEPLQPI